MITDINFYLLAIPALLIVGVSKGGFGGGIGLVAVPMMSLVISPVIAAAIMLPILILMDLFALRGFKGRFEKDLLWQIFPASLVGVVVGALSFRLLSETDIKLMIATLTLLFCADAARKSLSKKLAAAKNRRGIMPTIWCFLAGFTSFSVHAGGPALSFYLLPLRLDKTVFVSTSIAFFTFINLVKVVPYISLGLFSRETLTTALVLAPLAPIGIWLGVWLHNRIDETLFYRLCYLFLFITGLKLGYDALA